MQIRAAIIDLDGTLLDSKKRLSERSRRVLARARASGMEIIVATSRPPRMVLPLYPSMAGIEYMIYFNGALVRRNCQAYGARYPIDPKDLRDILGFFQAKDPSGYLVYEAEEDWYTNRILAPSEVHHYLDWDGTLGREDRFIPAGIKEDPEILSIDVYKVMFRKEGGYLREFEETFGGRLNIGSMQGETEAEVMHRTPSKEKAAEQVLEQLGIHPEETVVFGDEYNDVGLFEMCGYPVGMGNAIPPVKERSRRITETNDDDGVALELEKILAAGGRMDG